MNDPIVQLCKLIAEKLRDEPEASLAELVAHIEGLIAANSHLAAALQTQQMQQDNRDGAKGFQTLVEDGGTVFIEGNHYHLSEPEKFQAVLEAILKSFQAAETKTVTFEGYLKSLVTTYEQWWKFYALTDVIGQDREQSASYPFNFELMVKMAPQERENTSSKADSLQVKREKTERLPVLEGLRKYAGEHVLLVGRPGSGKSTALIRLLLEMANHALEGKTGQIPILVELRYWQTSILERIKASLYKHAPCLDLNDATLNTLLRQGQFLLLIDGLNELPSEDARRDVARFEKDFAKAPMIFTTREINLGDELGLEKQLEMQPLTETQMQQFVSNYLGQEKGENLLRQLKDHLRDLGQTPLLLAMLCSISRSGQALPTNLGEVFRQFTQFYEQKLKGDVPDPFEHRDDWSKLLQYLAFAMMQGSNPKQQPTELSIAIPQEKAEQILTEFLQDRDPYPAKTAERCLKDLLKHHLIQTSGNQIEFRHQLIQEYYAAEQLLLILPDLSDEELKCNYLNLLKWTESFNLLMALMLKEINISRVVKLALEVDLILGAKLSVPVRPSLKSVALNLINKTGAPFIVKLCILSLVSSKNTTNISQKNERLQIQRTDGAISDFLTGASWTDLKENLRNPDLSRFSNPFNEFSDFILKIIDSNPEFYRDFDDVMQKLGQERLVSHLIDSMSSSDFIVRSNAAYLLGKIGNTKVVDNLLVALREGHSHVSRVAAESLGKIGGSKAIDGLLEALGYDDPLIRAAATKSLGKIRGEEAIQKLSCLLSNDDSWIRMRAADALGMTQSEIAIPSLVKVLQDKCPSVRSVAVRSLGQIGISSVLELLLKVACEDKDDEVCGVAVDVLGTVGSGEVAVKLDILLKNKKINCNHERVLKALHKISKRNLESEILTTNAPQNRTEIDLSHLFRSNEALETSREGALISIPIVKMLKDNSVSLSHKIRIVETLGRIGGNSVENALIDILEKSQRQVGFLLEEELVRALVEALGRIGGNLATIVLIDMIKNGSFTVELVVASIEALGKIGDKIAVPYLINYLERWPLWGDAVKRKSAKALGKIGDPRALSNLWEICLDKSEINFINEIITIQNRCKYYSYEIFLLLCPRDHDQCAL